jgi:transketolase N-terminal domain/subunit
MAEEMIDIADGTMDEGTVPEDTKRAKLRIETRASIIAFNNKSRFGKETTINVNVDLKQALEEASMRAEVIEGEVVDD